MTPTSKFIAIAMTAILTSSCGGRESAAENKVQFTVGDKAVQLSEICDSAKTARHMAQYPERWQATFDYLQNTDLAKLEAGTYDVLPDGEAFAIVSEYTPKEPDSCRFEAHRRYIDLQYLISGSERMGIARPEAMTVETPYVDDIEFYTPDGVEGALYDMATPADFFVFFPDDPHRPSMKADGDVPGAPVKKVVVKIKY